MATMPGGLIVPLSWPQILKRTFYEAFWKDQCPSMAAQLAYYFFFALFPTLLFLVAVASYFPLASRSDQLFETIGGIMPPAAFRLIIDQLTKLSNSRDAGLLTLGMLLAVASSSTAMTAIIDTLNRAYDIEEGRPWWHVRLTAIALTIGVSLFILVSFALVIAGPAAATRLADVWNLGPAFEWTWKIAQWPVVFILASTGISLIYYFAPDVVQRWMWLMPGSVFATTLWLVASLAFKYYVANWSSYTETYGLIGAVMILLLWFYISALVILVGAEMNAEIEHAAPAGKNPGEKVAGEQQVLGKRLMRTWLRRRRAHGERPPAAREVKAVVDARDTPGAGD